MSCPTTIPTMEYKVPSKIIGVQFSMLSPEEIRKNSVVEVKTRNTFISSKPVVGGLFDPRMGVLDPGLICPTDGHNYLMNPGYFGHIELVKPVFFIQHVKEIMKVCRCVCFKCSKLLIEKRKHMHLMNKNSEDRWDAVVKLISGNVRRCGEKTSNGCGCKQPTKINLEGMSSIYALWENMNVGMATAENAELMDEINANNNERGEETKDMKIKLTPEIILKIFKRITDEDVYFMGFHPKWSRPEWMVCEVLPVPPPQVRPSVKYDNQQRSEDDLTHIYSAIIKYNQFLKEKMDNPDTPGKVIEGWTDILQHSIAMIVNNKLKGVAPMAQRSGRPLKCIMDRINSKNGRIRGNLMGKRVDFSARTVITGDPNLSIREIGIPLKIAKNLTKPVVVNARNRNYLMALMRNGPDNYPGAKILERKTGETISLKYIDLDMMQLNEGDIVHRHMVNGDVVLFNRQPSLHRLSMMCHIVRVMSQGDSFRMNVSTTKPYNADFDGDEMNAHLAQSLIAESELRNLAAIPYQQISPTSNSPIIGIYQDSLLGAYRFTREDIKLSPRQAMNLLMNYNKLDLLKLQTFNNNRRDYITNFEVLSQILPPLSFKRVTGLFREDEEDKKTSNHIVEIRNGRYIRGQLEKSSLGTTSKSILHRLFNDFGHMACADFNDDLQAIVTEYMKTSSFSVGISDLIANKTVYDRISQIINEQKAHVQTIIDKVHLGIFENSTAYSNMNEFETIVTNTLNKATDESGKVGRKSLNKDNRFVMIVESGSKGSLINISQMLCCLGQQNLDGKRIPYGLDSRTLPHFTKYDDSPKARGFIENSFISGLTATELFFHAMAGRIGLIDTAVKSVVGNTPIVIIENGISKYIEIGEWIDNKMDSSLPNQIQRFAEKNMEYLELELDNPVFIPTTDENGKVTWGELTAVTRHDPGERLYEIRTASGRTVVVAESESLLVWKHDKGILEKIHSLDVKVGDYVPVCSQLSSPPPSTIHSYVKIETIASSYFETATTTEPWKERSRLCEHTFSLNKENGTFIGIYLERGSILFHNKVVYFKCEESSLRKILRKWVKEWVIDTLSYKSNGNSEINIEQHLANILQETTSGLYVRSTQFVQFIQKIVGNKKRGRGGFMDKTGILSQIMLTCPEAFVRGLLIGIYSCSAIITRDSIEIHQSQTARYASTTIYNHYLSLLCSRLGIHGEFTTATMDSSLLIYKIQSNWIETFADNISIVNGHKEVQILALLRRHRQQLRPVKVEEGIKSQHNNVILDKILSISILETVNIPKLYDVTVPSTLNFGIANGLMLRDTSQTGYIQRRLIKGLEDLKVEYDMTVRNSKGKIIQFSYGDDDFDSTKIENQSLPFVDMSIQDIYNHYSIPDVTDKVNRIFTKSTFNSLHKEIELTKIKSHEYIEKMIESRKHVIEKVFKMKNENVVKVPVAFQSIIANVEGMFELEKDSAVDITPLQAWKLIEQCLHRMNCITPFVKTNALFEILYYYYLSPRDLLYVKRFHQKALIYLLEIIYAKYREALVHPGEMVGVIGGQAIGEPSTQLTLNTFHNTGSATKSNVTRGVPRIEEILRLTENPKNPSMVIHLRPLEESMQNKAANYANMITHTKLVYIVQNVQILYDPNDRATQVVEDKVFIQQFYKFEEMWNENGCGASATSAANKSKWVIRLTMNKETMLEKNITMDDIHYAVENSSFKDDVTCVYTDFNSDNLIFRIRVSNSIFNKNSKKQKVKTLDQSDEIYLLTNFQNALLNNIVLRGIEGIKNTLIRKVQNNIELDEDGNKYTKKDIWVLDTNGSNLLNTLGLDFIDYRKTISNDIKEVFHVLGIEATRKLIFNELNEVFEFSDVYINYHHMSLLCDRMTCNKGLVAIFRFKSGLMNDDTGPISKSTFEVHTEVLLNASRHADFDNMRGVSANVMCGQYGNYGTSSFQVLLDNKAFIKSIEVDNLAEDDIYLNEGYRNNQIHEKMKQGEKERTHDSVCGMKNLVVENNVENITSKEIKEDVCDDNYQLSF